MADKYLSYDGLSHLIGLIKANRSYVGMVIYSTTLNTAAKVKAQYGGITWTQITDTCIIACGSTYAAGSTVAAKVNDTPLIVSGDTTTVPKYKAVYVWERTK